MILFLYFQFAQNSSTRASGSINWRCPVCGVVSTTIPYKHLAAHETVPNKVRQDIAEAVSVRRPILIRNNLPNNLREEGTYSNLGMFRFANWVRLTGALIYDQNVGLATPEDFFNLRKL